MRLALVLVVALLILSAGMMIGSLTRGSARDRIKLRRHRDAISQAYLSLSQIQAFSSDDYAKNLAGVTITDISKTLVDEPKSIDNKE